MLCEPTNAPRSRSFLLTCWHIKYWSIQPYVVHTQKHLIIDCGKMCCYTFIWTVYSSQLWRDVKDFFCRLFDPNISQGAKDYYAAMLFFDILCFITIAAGVNSFGVSINICNMLYLLVELVPYSSM